MSDVQTYVKMDERGRVVIPKPIREELGIDGKEANVKVTVEYNE